MEKMHVSFIQKNNAIYFIFLSTNVQHEQDV